LKKVLFTLFVIILFTSVANAESVKITGLSNEWANKYRYHSLVFLPDNHAIDTFGATISTDRLNLFPYVAFNPNADYFEWGMSLDGTITISETISARGIFFPFGWDFKGNKNWGAVASAEVIYNNLITVGFHRSIAPNNPEWRGNLILLGASKNIFGFNLKAEAGYNWHFWTPESGFNGMAEVSRTFTSGKFWIKPVVRYFVAEKGLSQNDLVLALVTGCNF
jgi:hypothetical protein